MVASVHLEMLPWLGADWAYFPATGRLVLSPSPGTKPDVSVRYESTCATARV